MTTVPSGQYRHSVSLSPKYRPALRLKNGKPHQSPSAQNRKMGSDCSFHASEPLENCSFSDLAGTRVTLSFMSYLLLLLLCFCPLPIQLGDFLPCVVAWHPTPDPAAKSCCGAVASRIISLPPPSPRRVSAKARAPSA